jgi:predicted aspartyl protease
MSQGFLLGSAILSAHATCTLGAVAVLPVRMQHGSIVMQVDINGQQANLILDTGAFATVLTPEAASRLGVRMAQLDSDTQGVGGVQHTYRGTAAHMRVGNMKADGMELAGSQMLAASGPGGVDGLFGMNMMAAYDIDLDLAGQHAILFEADGNCRTPTVALAQPLYDVPLVSITHNRQADIDIVINGKPLRAVVDSGASSTTMFRQAASRLGVDMRALHGPGHHEGRGIGPRPVAAMTHVFETVSIGNLTIHNMPIEVIDQANTGINRVHVGSLLEDPSDGEAGGEDMLLGADFMQKVHVWISHSSQRMIMQYPPQLSVLPK